MTIYLDSISISNTSIDTLANLSIVTTSHTVTWHKTAASEEHTENVNSALVEYVDKAIVLNIDDYQSIHTKRMPNIITIFTAT